MTDYYKSLVSDDEVISALIKESQVREGKLPQESTRIRPNINFFQRTVSNLVTVNRRISTTKVSKKCDTNSFYSGSKSRVKSGSSTSSNDYIRDLLLNKIDFDKSSSDEDGQSSTKSKKISKFSSSKWKNTFKECQQSSSSSKCGEFSLSVSKNEKKRPISDNGVNSSFSCKKSAKILKKRRNSGSSSGGSDVCISRDLNSSKKVKKSGKKRRNSDTSVISLSSSSCESEVLISSGSSSSSSDESSVISISSGSNSGDKKKDKLKKKKKKT